MAVARVEWARAAMKTIAKPMTLAEQLFMSARNLPPASVKEVLDFAQFLAERQARQEDEELMLAQQTATREWDNTDDEAWSHAPAV